MAIALELRPDLETRLREEAHASGLSIGKYIDYEELPRWNAALGLLVSSQGRLQYDLIPINPRTVPATATAPASFAADIVIGQKDRSAVQLFPFTLVSFRTGDFVKWNKQFTWSPAFGVGVNPNNGDTQAEYFEGAYLAVGPVSFFAGIHNGRPPTRPVALLSQRSRRHRHHHRPFDLRLVEPARHRHLVPTPSPLIPMRYAFSQPSRAPPKSMPRVVGAICATRTNACVATIANGRRAYRG